MFFYGYISKASLDQDQNIVNKYLNYSIENNLDIKKIFTEGDIFSDDLFEKIEFKDLVKLPQLKNASLLVNSSLDLAKNLIDLSNIYILLSISKVKIDVIENNSGSILLDGLNRLGYSKPKLDKYSKISETINLKSLRGSVLNRIPIGYEKSIDGKFKVKEYEKLAVRKIHKLYSGNYGANKRLGLRKIVQIIDKEFDDLKYKWNTETIKNILKNRFYTGVYLRDAKIISDNHEQIITSNEYNYVQEIFKENLKKYKLNSKAVKNNKRISKLVCSYCNSNLNISYHSRKWLLRNGVEKKKVYNYVKCKNDCKFIRKSIDLKNYLNKDFDTKNLLFIEYKNKLRNLRKNLKYLIRGKLSLDFFKNEIDSLMYLENWLKLNNENKYDSAKIKKESITLKL